MACSSVFGQGHIFVTKDLGQASCSLGVKGNEPNFGQTIYSSFLIWFTDSSSGISSTIKTKQNKNILYQNEKSKIEKHERDGATKLTSKKNCAMKQDI